MPAKSSKRGVVDWAPAVFLAIFSLVIAAVAIAQPRDGQKAIAIYPPWWSVGETLAAAAEVAPILGGGAFPFVVVVRTLDARVAADLKASGALLVVDAARFQFCETKPRG